MGIGSTELSKGEKRERRRWEGAGREERKGGDTGAEGLS